MALPRSGLIRFPRFGTPSPSVPGAADIFASLPTAVVVIDGEGVIRHANSAAESLLNLSLATLSGRTLTDALGLNLGEIAGDMPVAAYDIELDLADGRRPRVDLLVGPLPDHPGWRAVAIQSRSGSALIDRRKEQAGGTLAAVGAAAMLAHEIKNPLSGIRGAAQLLEATIDADGAALTRLIRDEVDRVAALVDRMEGFTDPRPLTLGPQNIHLILNHCRDVAAQGFARDLHIREVYDPSLPAVAGHRDALIQIFLNLIRNAAEALEKNGPPFIVLTTAYRHGTAVATADGHRRSLPIEICVIDEGPGAPAELAEHLFDPFVTSKRSGGGLGLALVAKLVGDQGGIVEYAREGRPPRTVFRVLLPRHEGRP